MAENYVDEIENEDDGNHDPSGIWFTSGGWNRMTYNIQGDSPTRSAAFTDCDCDTAFAEWRTLVDLPHEMDSRCRFFRVEGKDSVFCLHENDDIHSWDFGEEIESALENGDTPEGWTEVHAKDVIDLIKFEYCEIA